MSKRKRKRLPDGLFDADIESLSSDARGVTHIDGKTVFVHGALPDEQVRFRYTRRHRRYDEGVAEEIVRPSQERVEPPCEHALLCGGCSLQHLNPSAQIRMKQEILMNNLRQMGQVTPEQIVPPLTGPTQGYRRKARLGVRDVPAKGRVLVGFREQSHRYLADIRSCKVLHASVGERLLALSDLIGGMDARQGIAQIEVAVSDDRSALIFRHLQPLSADDRGRLSGFAAEHGFDIYLQAGGPDTIAPLYPDPAPPLQYRLPEYDITVRFLASDFTQVNTDINRDMVHQAIGFMDLNETDRVLDLFCGLGNFTLPLARRAGQVTGVEGDDGLVQRAADNARLNGLENIQFHTANLFEDFSTAPWAGQYYDKILLDPPRSGAQQVVENMQLFQPRRIVYVSCHPATLARDAGILAQQGYRLSRAGVMDMFPHTAHVESMAVFDRLT